MYYHSDVLNKMLTGKNHILICVRIRFKLRFLQGICDSQGTLILFFIGRPIAVPITKVRLWGEDAELIKKTFRRS